MPCYADLVISMKFGEVRQAQPSTLELEQGNALDYLLYERWDSVGLPTKYSVDLYDWSTMFSV